MAILTDWHFSISADDILRGQGADPEKARTKRPVLLKAARTALHIGFSSLNPIAAMQELTVREIRHTRILLEGGVELTGPLVARHLSGAQRITAVVCTIGPELENLASSWMQENPLLALALDGLGNAAVEILAQQVCGRIGEQAQAKSLDASTPLFPGSPEWPVEVGQTQIFTLLDPSQAGITFSSGGMMIPQKSISFVVGIGPEMAQTDACEVCSLKETCRYRHA
jgi:hypothetical protein